MYQCRQCPFSSLTQRKYIAHYSFHRHTPNFQFPCGLGNCQKSYTSYSAYKAHVHRDHRGKGNIGIYDRIQNQKVALQCYKPLCQKKCVTLKLLIAHLKTHLNGPGSEIVCPFKKCKGKFKLVPSFSSHISRYHKKGHINSYQKIVS